MSFKIRSFLAISALLVLFGCDKSGGGNDNQPPQAKIKATHTSYLEGDNWILDAKESFDPDGTIKKYEWSVDSALVSDDDSIYLSSLKPGKHLIKLKVWDDEGAIDSTQKELDVPNVCSSVDAKKDRIFKIMRRDYLWYKNVPSTPPKNTRTLGEFLDKLTYKKYDKWSYIESKQAYNDYFNNSTYIGIGVSFSFVDDKVFVRFVYDNSPASEANLKRGDEILKINGKTIKEISENRSWSTIFGENKEGVKVSMEIKTKEGETKTLELTKRKINAKSVLISKVIKLEDGKKIGYLHFLSFVNPSKDELLNSFRYFRDQNIDELVLDLRYNGGGLVSIAALLGSLIGGDKVDQKDFATLKFNDLNTKFNYTYKFESTGIDLDLSRVFVLTSHSTCSASELVINGLKPFLDVIVIGDRTCGKPVGMSGIEVCDYILNAINFATYNANNQGEYFDGIEAQCYVKDNLFVDLGSLDEPLLKEALNYIQTQECSSRNSKIIDTINKTPQIYKGFRRELGAF
jgi:C-terminal peptidase prc